MRIQMKQWTNSNQSINEFISLVEGEVEKKKIISSNIIDKV